MGLQQAHAVKDSDNTSIMGHLLGTGQVQILNGVKGSKQNGPHREVSRPTGQELVHALLRSFCQDPDSDLRPITSMGQGKLLKPILFPEIEKRQLDKGKRICLS